MSWVKWSRPVSQKASKRAKGVPLGVSLLNRLAVRLRATPRRYLNPLVAVVLAQGAPLALLLTRAFEDDRLNWEALTADSSLWWHWFAEELWADQTAYLWVIVASTALMASLGALLGAQEDRLRELATFDAMTGLMNRRTFSQRLTQELARAQRYSRDLSLLILDLDWLKSINDRHGHNAGDLAIRAVAHAIKESLRATDLCARYAGDEFVALLPETRAQDAIVIAQRIGERVGEASLGPQGSRLSVSIGVADLDTAEAHTAEDLFVAADEALYRAKAAGRNNVAVAEAVPPSYSRRGA